MFTLTFCCVSPETRDFLQIVDQTGNVVTLEVDASTKSSTYTHPDVIAFCLAQGNDCRIFDIRG